MANDLTERQKTQKRYYNKWIAIPKNRKKHNEESRHWFHVNRHTRPKKPCRLCEGK